MLYLLKLKAAQLSNAFARLAIQLGEGRPDGRVARMGEWLEDRTERLAERSGVDMRDLYAPVWRRGYWRAF